MYNYISEAFLEKNNIIILNEGVVVDYIVKMIVNKLHKVKLSFEKFIRKGLSYLKKVGISAKEVLNIPKKVFYMVKDELRENILNRNRKALTRTFRKTFKTMKKKTKELPIGSQLGISVYLIIILIIFYVFVENSLLLIPGVNLSLASAITMILISPLVEEFLKRLSIKHGFSTVFKHIFIWSDFFLKLVTIASQIEKRGSPPEMFMDAFIFRFAKLMAHAETFEYQKEKLRKDPDDKTSFRTSVFVHSFLNAMPVIYFYTLDANKPYGLLDRDYY